MLGADKSVAAGLGLRVSLAEQLFDVPGKLRHARIMADALAGVAQSGVAAAPERGGNAFRRYFRRNRYAPRPCVAA